MILGSGMGIDLFPCHVSRSLSRSLRATRALEIIREVLDMKGRSFGLSSILSTYQLQSPLLCLKNPEILFDNLFH